jgi:hypothetical protein
VTAELQAFLELRNFHMTIYPGEYGIVLFKYTCCVFLSGAVRKHDHILGYSVLNYFLILNQKSLSSVKCDIPHCIIVYKIKSNILAAPVKMCIDKPVVVIYTEYSSPITIGLLP